MKISFDKIKDKMKKFDFEKAKTITKEFVEQHYKVAGSVAVVTALCGICAVTLVSNLNKKNTPVGVMMTLTDVSEDKEAFAGNTFEVAGISYDDMMNVYYETEQLAQLEKSEKQIEEILSAKRQDRKDQAALEALTAQYIEPETVVSADDNATVAVVAPSTAPTYMDENGTYEYIGEFVLTGYCACPICCGAYSNMENPTTASGTTATAGRTVAASSAYPFGTQLVINGQVYTVEDRGGAVNGNHIDIFFSTHQEALNFGRQSASVYRVVQ